MKKASIEDMEMGNIIFGNSRGEYCVEPRGEYQDAFCEFLFKNKFDMYGYFECDNREYFENDTFIIRPYYWGEDEAKQDLPNFVYKPTGLEIDWYKYPMRDAYSNQDISIDEFKEILSNCEKSMGENNGTV